MSRLAFEKWEGLGNDFVIVEAEIRPEQAQRLCDRRHGIGADGVLIVARSEDGSASRMTVLNADGTRPQMCGNGLRCVASYVAERLDGTVGAQQLAVRSDTGEHWCDLARRASGLYDVSADMGVAVIGAQFSHPSRGLGRSFVEIDVGNPHAVSFEPFDDDDLDEFGPMVDRATEGGRNVELCRVSDGGRRLEVLVWERGVGRTLACGTGACACAAAAVALGFSRVDVPIEVWLPGGALQIVVGPRDPTGNFPLHMRGPARRVFVGEVEV